MLDGLAFSGFIRPSRELGSRSGERILPRRVLITTYSVSRMLCTRERRSSLVWGVIDIDTGQSVGLQGDVSLTEVTLWTKLGTLC